MQKIAEDFTSYVLHMGFSDTFCGDFKMDLGVVCLLLLCCFV